MRRGRYSRLGAVHPGSNRRVPAPRGRRTPPRNGERPGQGSRMGRRLHGRADRENFNEHRGERDGVAGQVAVGRREESRGAGRRR